MTSNRYTPHSRKRWRKEVIMETLLILIMLVVVLDIASLLWGYDSTEKMDSPEWERRATWDASYHKSVRNKKSLLS
jgi:hypothetical protein